MTENRENVNTASAVDTAVNMCAVNRDRYREDAKMAQQARKMMYAAKVDEREEEV